MEVMYSPTRTALKSGNISTISLLRKADDTVKLSKNHLRCGS